MQAAKIVWTKKDAGFQAEMPGDVTLYVTPDQTAGAFGAKAKRGTQWRAGVSVWNAKTSTLSRFGRDAYGEMCADAKTAKALAESIYRAEISDRETQAATDAANAEAALKIEAEALAPYQGVLPVKRRTSRDYERHGFLISRSAGASAPWRGWRDDGVTFRADTLKGAFQMAREHKDS